SIGGDVADALAVAVQECGDAADQIERRENVDYADEIPQNDLRKLQAQALGVDHADIEEALANGLATPAPFEDDAVSDRNDEIENHAESGGEIGAKDAGGLGDFAGGAARESNCGGVDRPRESASNWSGERVGEDDAFGSLDAECGLAGGSHS